jgi:hypothetical protein
MTLLAGIGVSAEAGIGKTGKIIVAKSPRANSILPFI